MDTLDQLIESRRTSLSTTILSLGSENLSKMQAFIHCDKFISAATSEAAYGDSYSFFGHMRAAGDAIPLEFEGLYGEGMLKGPDRRIQPYIRCQLFVALVAEIEDFIFQLLLSVFHAYPHKIHTESIKFGRILELGSMEAVVDEVSIADITRMFYSSPKEYRKRIEDVLSMDPSVLEPLWPVYSEMKARRDVGLHNNWKQNDIYKKKVLESKGSLPQEEFLGVSREYFGICLDMGKKLVDSLVSHCTSKFDIVTETQS